MIAPMPIIKQEAVNLPGIKPESRGRVTSV